MKHVNALLFKFIIVAGVLVIALSILTDISFVDIMYISIAVTVIAYIIGDLIVLPATNNTIATIADTVLALITIYMFSNIWLNMQISFVDSLISAIALGVGEWFFHKYVKTSVLSNRRKE